MKNSFLLLSAIFLLGAFTNCQTKKAPETTKKKPNILFLFADDQRADALECSGNPYIKTPNIDKLATTGIRFTNNYFMGGEIGAVCAPSRAMLMSGKSLFHVYEKLDGVTTMPMYFGQHGYETFGTGKWHNGGNSFEASFQKGKNVFLGGMCDHFNVPVRNMGPDGKLSKPEKKGFSADLFAGAAINFLKDYAKGSRTKPFFCYVAFTSPHDPRSPRQDYVGMYPDGTIPVPGNFMALPSFAFDDLNCRDERLAPWPRTPFVVQQSLSDYYAMISLVDKKVGDIIQTLKENGMYDNTIIVYSADNGLSIGSHGLMGKQNVYEESVKLPLIISGPGIPKNELRDAMTYLYDIFPTLTDLCQLPAPEGVDGTDFTSVLMGNQKEIRKSLYTIYRNTARAVRTDKKWKLIRYPQCNYTQLFNLNDDPLEMNNLAKQSEYQTKLDSMMDLLNDWYQKTGDTATMHPKKFRPMDFDYKKLNRTPDQFQPEYVLKRFFKDVDVKKVNHINEHP